MPILLLGGSGICLLWMAVDGLLLLRVSGLSRIRLLRVDRLSLALGLSLLLALAELDIADSGTIVAQAPHHEEDKVDDAQDPNDGS